MIVAIAMMWGLSAGLAVLGLTERVAATRRARAIRRARRRRRRPRRPVAELVSRHLHGAPIGVVVRVLGAPSRRRRLRRDEDALLSELPVAVDLIGVAMAAGCTAFRAVAVSAEWAPARIAAALAGIDRNVALGASFDGALRDAGDRNQCIRPLTEALRTTARLGSPTVAALVRLAQEVRADVRRRAEARARTVPVRLLFPLVFCILPAFALLTVLPVLLDGIAF